MANTFILVPGRSSQQGCGINEGKFGETYRAAISFVQMSPSDMDQLDLSEGDSVEMTSEFGEICLPVKAAKVDELPDGLLFMAYGHLSSLLMGGDTHGSGMPTSKGIDVQVTKVQHGNHTEV